MTTEEKLIALGFKETGDNFYYKRISLTYSLRIAIYYSIDGKKGRIENLENDNFVNLNNFTELLKWNYFYEKKRNRVIRRYTSHYGSKTQDLI